VNIDTHYSDKAFHHVMYIDILYKGTGKL